jgi:hypothetical protein
MIMVVVQIYAVHSEVSPGFFYAVTQDGTIGPRNRIMGLSRGNHNSSIGDVVNVQARYCTEDETKTLYQRGDILSIVDERSPPLRTVEFPTLDWVNENLRNLIMTEYEISLNCDCCEGKLIQQIEEAISKGNYDTVDMLVRGYEDRTSGYGMSPDVNGVRNTPRFRSWVQLSTPMESTRAHTKLAKFLKEETMLAPQ